jgi:hypothetical protein
MNEPQELTKSYSLTLTPSTMNRLRKEADRDNRSLSSYIIILLTDYVRQLEADDE